MIKEAKNIDFYTSGRQPSEADFARISEWIKKKKENQTATKQALIKPQNLSQHGIAKSEA